MAEIPTTIIMNRLEKQMFNAYESWKAMYTTLSNTKFSDSYNAYY